ncbi:MAG: integrase core domain-containing protein [Alphaproteobacteria bacterium]|jgi:putative transposase
MWTAKGLVDLYFLVFLHLGTRRIWLSPCTHKPDSAWVVQQGRNFLQHAEDVDLPVEIVMRDNDGKYPAQFDEVLKSSGAKIKRNTPWSPNLRAHVERVIQTLKQEVLDHFVVVAERHLNYLIREASAWYNQERPHSARDHLPPANEKPPDLQVTLKMSEVVCTTRLGGHLKSYSRRAA